MSDFNYMDGKSHPTAETEYQDHSREVLPRWCVAGGIPASQWCHSAQKEF